MKSNSRTSNPFAAAVRACPEDDLPRLVLAAFVEERFGGEWPQFVRRQCAHPTLNGGCYGDAVVGQLCPSFETPDGSGSEYPWRTKTVWCPACDELLTSGLPECCLGEDRHKVRRGFIDSFHLSAQDWVSHGNAILAHPLVVAPAVELTTRLVLGEDYSEFGSWSQPDGPNKYLYALGDTAPADDDPYVVWCERQGDGTGIIRELLRRRWPAVASWKLPTMPAPLVQRNREQRHPPEYYLGCTTPSSGR